MLKNHKGHFGIIVCTFWMLQFDRGNCNYHWILLCVVGQSQRGEDGWWCRGKEFGIRKTTGPSTGKHYWRNLDAFTLYSTIRSLMPNKTGTLCCFFLSSFRMLPFPSFSKIGIGYGGNYFVHALPIDTGNLGLTICYSPIQVNHLAPKALFFFFAYSQIVGVTEKIARLLLRCIIMRCMVCPILVLTQYIWFLCFIYKSLRESTHLKGQCSSMCLKLFVASLHEETALLPCD